MIHKVILPFLVSLLGLVAGYVLAFIAAEEIKPGEKYFRWLQKLLVAVFVVVVDYNLVAKGKVLLAIILTFIAAIIFLPELKPILELKTKLKLKILPGRLERSDRLIVLGTYLFFALAYFLSADIFPTDQRLLLASLIFLYGLPAGTLMRKV